MNLQYNDLIVVPFPNRRPGIYWLRLYAGSQSDVAVLTEVPGNPSRSITGGRMRILEWIGREHGTPPNRLVLFEIYPRGSRGRDQASVARIGPLSGPRPASREEIESLVGSRLPQLPSHADLYARVLDLGGGPTGTVYRTLYEIIPTLDLPPPQDLFRCPHHARFARRKARSPELARSWDIVRPGDRRTCAYHLPNWKAIADESVRVLRSVPGGDQEACFERATQGILTGEHLEILLSLFVDPVRIIAGAYDNGQHRACGLRFSGAAEVVISPGEEELHAEAADWTYLGDG